MPGKRKFDEQLAALDALRTVPDEARMAPLRKALNHQNNFIVAKAADLTRELHLVQLIPDLLTAYERFFHTPEKTDPQCWAKNAISRALASMEYQEPDAFLSGLRHIQMEPVWGGRSDTAGTLRGTCALALVQCRTLNDSQLLSHLIDLLADKDKQVRLEVIRAIEQVASPSATLVLRVKAVLAADEPEILGACYGAILSVEGLRAISWVSQFLASQDDAAAEAALAISGTRSGEGFDCLKQALLAANDPWWRSVLVSAIALTRQPAATEFLLDQIADESPDAEGAIDAILRAVPSPELIRRLETLVSGNPRLARHLTQLQKTS